MPDLIARCLVELGEITDNEQWVLLLPRGYLPARDGRRWHNPDPEGVVTRSLAHAGTTDPVIDYEHQTDHAGRNGQAAPAAGWIKELRAEADGIRGRITWTDKALAHIRAKEYRYFSPTFTYDKNGRIGMVLRGALTNNPALDLPALASNQPENSMNEKLLKLLAFFGLTEANADDDAALDAALAKAEAALDNGDLIAVAKALDLAEDATPDAILAKCKTLKDSGAPDPTKYVPVSDFQAMATELKTLQDDRSAEKAEALVADGMKDGKIPPAMKDWALAYAKKDIDNFIAYLAVQPVIVAPGSTATPAPDGDPAAALTADELAVCKAMGIEPDKFKASRQEHLVALGGAAD